MLALATAALLFAVFWTGYHLGETAPIRRKMRERKRIENSLPKVKIIKMIIVLALITYQSQGQLLLSMGAGYADKTVYGELVVGAKVNKTAVYYNQVALLAADKPAYFGLATSYDVFVRDNYKLTASIGGYYRKQSSDVDGKLGGNYFTTGGSLAYNKEWFSVVVRYMDNHLQAGVLFSGLIQ